MTAWNAAHYLKYGDERTRPAADLAARIQLAAPRKIVDLGCGPGNSTQVLRQRWPQADVLGVDQALEMIESAQKAFPEQTWLVADAAQWTPAETIDLVYSNAALQWIPDHESLMPRLLSLVASGGALAFQIPSGTFAKVRTLTHEVSHDPAWTEQMAAARSALTMESPSFYYDILSRLASSLDIWETEYHHVMDSPASIIDWMSSTGLRPFLAGLTNESQRNDFLAQLLQRVRESYELRADGKVLFPFRRTFVIAYR